MTHEHYLSKTILIALVVIILGLLFLIILAGPNFSETDREFIKSAGEYQDATMQVSKDISVAYQNANYDGMVLSARKERDLAIYYSTVFSEYEISAKLYPYRDELLDALENENVSASYLILAVENFKQGQDATGLAYFQMAETQRADECSHLDQAWKRLEIAERPWWYYLRY